MRAAATPKKIACGKFLAIDRRRLQSISKNKVNCFANDKNELLMVHQTKRTGNCRLFFSSKKYFYITRNRMR